MRLYELLESLDKDQKRVGQVGGEEKARKIGPVLGKPSKKHPYDDRLVGEETVQEVAPPGMEDWIKDRKADFKKRYGDRWKTVLYATAWKRHKNESTEPSVAEGLNEAVEFTNVSSSSSTSITENVALSPGALKNQQKNQQGLAAVKQAGINLVPLAYHPATKAPVYIWDDGGRPVVVVNMGGFTFPFYNSSGYGGKQSVAIAKWYPFFGIGPGGIGPGWFNKGDEADINNYYGSEKLKQIAQILDNTLGRPPRDPNNVFGWMDYGKGQEANALKVINNGLSPQKDRNFWLFNKSANSLLKRVGGKLYPEGNQKSVHPAQQKRDEEDRKFYNSPEFLKQIGMAEANNDKVADRYDQDEWDQKIQRLKKLAGAGPLKTVWDPVKQVYKNVPVNQKPTEK